MNAETMPLISFNYPLYIQGLKYMHGIGLVILKLTENQFFLPGIWKKKTFGFRPN